jgi:hypothetical protein
MPSAESAIGGAQSYYQNLLSGSRPAIMQAEAPEINATLNQSDAAKRQLAARGTARGGGTAGTNQQVGTSTQAQIDNALFGARPGAAGALGSLGTSELGTAETATGNLASTALSSRGQSAQLNRQMQQQVGSVIGSVLGAIF